MIKEMLVVALISLILILSFTSCNSKLNSVSKSPIIPKDFSTYSPNKELHIYGDISSTDFQKGKGFTVNAHIKNLTINKYILSSQGDPVTFQFYKIEGIHTIAGTEQVQNIAPNGILNYQTTFKPSESGNYKLYITSSIVLSLKLSDKTEKFVDVPLVDSNISIK